MTRKMRVLVGVQVAAVALVALSLPFVLPRVRLYQETRTYGTVGEAHAALRRDPEDALALRTLTLEASRTGDRGTSIQLWERVVAREPGNGFARVMLAPLYIGSGRSEEAQRLLTPIARGSDPVALEAQKMLRDIGARLP